MIEEHGARSGLTGLIAGVHAVTRSIADACDVPDLALTVVVTGDITASVRERSQVERDFTPERSGGIVKGKT
ncbi:hypothetical protein, partial [Streptomyces sp. NPDC056937]